MNRNLLHVFWGTGFFLFGTTSSANETSVPDDNTISATISYKLGYQFGQQFAISFHGFSTEDTDPAYFAQGLRDGINGKTEHELSKEVIHPSLKAYSNKLKKRLADRAATNAERGKNFLKDFAKEEGIQKTESGILYRVIEAGENNKYDEATHGKLSKFRIVYKGSLIDGTVFDETATPLTFSLHNMKPGIAEILKTMPIGAKWHVVIPSELAYGEDGPGIIGPNSTLIFDIKLVDIETAPQPAQDKDNQ